MHWTYMPSSTCIGKISVLSLTKLALQHKWDLSMANLSWVIILKQSPMLHNPWLLQPSWVQGSQQNTNLDKCGVLNFRCEYVHKNGEKLKYYLKHYAQTDFSLLLTTQIKCFGHILACLISAFHLLTRKRFQSNEITVKSYTTERGKSLWLWCPTPPLLLQHRHKAIRSIHYCVPANSRGR